MSDWSGLPYDVLENITRYLPLQDYFRFGAVCRFWSSIVKERRHSPAKQLPWLAFSYSSRSTAWRFFSLPEKKEYIIDIPEFYERRCCGSSHGWSVTVSEQLEIHLFNPFFRASIKLPPVLQYYEKVDFTGDYDMSNRNDRLYLRNRLIYKAVLSADPNKSQDYILMAIIGATHTLAFWRPGDVEWNELSNIEAPHDDVIWYSGNFYAATRNNSIIRVDLGQHPEARIVHRLSVYCGIWRTCYLVDLRGDLVFVSRKMHLDYGDAIDIKYHGPSRTTEFIVLKFDVLEERWVQLDGIGDCALFLGYNDSTVVSASEFPGCRKNCIYFTDDLYKDMVYGDVGIYSLMDKSIDRYYPSWGFHPDVLPRQLKSSQQGMDRKLVGISPPIWMCPNPW